MAEQTKKEFEAEAKRIMDSMHEEVIRLGAENLLLKQILEQKLKITLIPKLYNEGGSF